MFFPMFQCLFSCVLCFYYAFIKPLNVFIIPHVFHANFLSTSIFLLCIYYDLLGIFFLLLYIFFILFEIFTCDFIMSLYSFLIFCLRFYLYSLCMFWCFFYRFIMRFVWFIIVFIMFYIFCFYYVCLMSHQYTIENYSPIWDTTFMSCSN